MTALALSGPNQGYLVPGVPPIAEYPPSMFNLEVEAALLGDLMCDNRVIGDVADIVAEEDFYEPLHGRIYARIVAFADRNMPATPVTMAHLFHDDPAMADVGGAGGYLARLTGVATIIGARDFAAQVADLAQRRALFDAARALVVAACDPTLTKTAIVEQADMAMMGALASRSNLGSVPVCAAWDAALEDIAAEASGARPAGIKFHDLPDLNELGIRWRPGNLVILAGRPGMGKTALAVKASVAAAENGHGTLYISREVPVDEIATRIIADRLFVEGQSASFDDLQNDRLGAFDRQRIAEERQRVRDWPLHIYAPPSFQITKLTRTIRRYQRLAIAKGQRLDLVVIDHLGLVSGTSKRGKYEETTEVTNALKSVALETGVCILALSQLSRAVEQREDKRPQPADLRDSGSVEQDADAIAFVYREQHYLEQAEPDENSTDPKVVKLREAWVERMERARDRMEVFSAKARQGRKARRNLWFFMDRQAVRSSRHYVDRWER